MDRMMKDFAAIGGELFVMDDGWFGLSLASGFWGEYASLAFELTEVR